MCVCVCVCDVRGREAVSDAVQRQSFNNNLAGETIRTRQTLKYDFLENMLDIEQGGGGLFFTPASRLPSDFRSHVKSPPRCGSHKYV